MDFQAILSDTLVASAEYHETLGSTNDRARECAGEGCALPRLIVAGQQTAGRGRNSNRWWTGSGSLAMSLLLPADLIPRDVKQSILLSLVTGVALVDTLRSILSEHVSSTLGLHWPNDVMLAGRKLAGILIEALPDRTHIVGIGVNTNNSAADAPEDLRARVATLRDTTGAPCEHGELLLALMQALELALRQLAEDPKPAIARANELCTQRDQVLSIELGGELVTGRCQGIGPDGALLVDTPDGPRACCSGVVQ